ncbi:pH-response regulator protein palI/RIM9 [Scheffersomyces amazonensis]|uniref:pH-response regulator protein palI/RIM9 n=1 Tax=Scheffersomyces amazonensis TaxID=1078765 RepID=UPI00315D022D
MYKTLIVLTLCIVLCVVVQLLPVISVPLTSPDRNLYFSNYNNYTFGVLGICDLNSGICSAPRIGYPAVNSTFYMLADDSDFKPGGVELPSNATYTISKLLVMHLVAFSLTSLLLVFVLGLAVLQWIDDPIPLTVRFSKYVGSKESRQQAIITGSQFLSTGEGNEQLVKKPLRDITPYLNIILTIAITSFLCNLLGFLADILLFVPNLTYLGWLQLLPIICLALIITLSCFIKRSISSRKFLEDDQKYENDDMRTRKKVIGSRWSEDASDDGFYVYTNGFYTAQNNNNNNTNRGPNDIALRSGVLFHHNNDSQLSEWVHHSYQVDPEEISLNSEHHRHESDTQRSALHFNIVNNSP